MEHDALRRALGDMAAADADKAQLAQAVADSVTTGEGIEAIIWFLERIDQGAELTPAGYLPTAMVREGWERFPGELGWTDKGDRRRRVPRPLRRHFVSQPPLTLVV